MKRLSFFLFRLFNFHFHHWESFRIQLMIIMALNYICLLLIFVLLQTGGDGQRVVTAPGNCLRDSECDKRSEYCSLNHRCHTRQSENAGCLWNKACDYGLYCRGKTTGSGVCKRQKGLFEKCDRNDVESCAVNGNVRYMCSPETNRCVRTGFEGDVCIWNGDCQSEYYCKTMHLTLSGRCRKRLPEGAKCGLNDDYDDCQGVCSHGSADHLLPSERSKHSVCVTASTLGEACTESRHCRGHVDDNQGPRFDRNRYRVSPVICNIPKGDIGICEHAHKLIKKEGLKCNPSKDRCEARRGLSCGKTPTGPRCMFNVFDDDKYARPFCDINGKFSRCNNHDGIPTECREGSAIDILHSSIYEYSTEFDESFRCHRKREIVPQGSPCSHVSYAVCEKGTTCRTIPAIQGNYYKNPTTQFCVAMKNEGEECFSKFHYACNDGLKCHNNMCVKGNPDAIITHADFNGRCDLLPCIPHFKCLHTNGSTYGYCVLKNIAKSKGLCFDTALKTYVSCSSRF